MRERQQLDVRYKITSPDDRLTRSPRISLGLHDLSCCLTILGDDLRFSLSDLQLKIGFRFGDLGSKQRECAAGVTTTASETTMLVGTCVACRVS